MNAKSPNEIYSFICPKCNSFYVGQTENLRKRVIFHPEKITQCVTDIWQSADMAECDNGMSIIFLLNMFISETNKVHRKATKGELITALRADLCL